MTTEKKLENLNREELLELGASRGLSQEHMERLPCYSIISELKAKKSDSDSKSRRSTTKAPTASSIKQSVRELRTAMAEQEEEQTFDDSATVVDMEHVTQTTNPADQRYKRFKGLRSLKKTLMESISINIRLLERSLDHLDEDDVAVVEREIADIQQKLKLVTLELREIHEWFESVHAQKQEFYQQFLKDSRDVTGNLTSHFTRKLKHIQKYVADMKT